MTSQPAAADPTRSGPLSAPLGPRVRGLPWLGSALAMAGDLPAFLVASYRRHGPVFRLTMVGREFTVLAGRDANVFMTHAGAAQLRSREAWERFNLEAGSPRALTNLDGEPHARQRKVM